MVDVGEINSAILWAMRSMNAIEEGCCERLSDTGIGLTEPWIEACSGREEEGQEYLCGVVFSVVAPA